MSAVQNSAMSEAFSSSGWPEMKKPGLLLLRGPGHLVGGLGRHAGSGLGGFVVTGVTPTEELFWPVDRSAASDFTPGRRGGASVSRTASVPCMGSKRPLRRSATRWPSS